MADKKMPAIGILLGGAPKDGEDYEPEEDEVLSSAAKKRAGKRLRDALDSGDDAAVCDAVGRCALLYEQDVGEE